MKKGKQNIKSGGNFFKYTTTGLQTSVATSKNHYQSVADLELPQRNNLVGKNTSSKEAHNSSLCAVNQTSQNKETSSLKKFLSIFGGAQNLGGQITGRVSARESRSGSKKQKQIFTCNIKNMNVNMMGHRDPIQYNNPRQSIESTKNNSNVFQDKKIREKQQEKAIQQKIKKISIENDDLKLLNQKLKNQNIELKKQIKAVCEQRQIFEERFLIRQKQLQKKIYDLQRVNTQRQKCRQHQLIIQSLKKLLNEQLKKIIQLQKLKIEREQIEKLQQKINSNIYNSKNIYKSHTNNNSLPPRRKEHSILLNDEQQLSDRVINFSKRINQQIKIQGDDNNENEVSLIQQSHVLESIIQQATQEEQNYQSREVSSRKIQLINVQQQNSNKESNGDILKQVDEYLMKWRCRKQT